MISMLEPFTDVRYWVPRLKNDIMSIVQSIHILLIFYSKSSLYAYCTDSKTNLTSVDG